MQTQRLLVAYHHITYHHHAMVTRLVITMRTRNYSKCKFSKGETLDSHKVHWQPKCGQSCLSACLMMCWQAVGGPKGARHDCDVHLLDAGQLLLPCTPSALFNPWAVTVREPVQIPDFCPGSRTTWSFHRIIIIQKFNASKNTKAQSIDPLKNIRINRKSCRCMRQDQRIPQHFQASKSAIGHGK